MNAALSTATPRTSADDIGEQLRHASFADLGGVGGWNHFGTRAGFRENTGPEMLESPLFRAFLGIYPYHQPGEENTSWVLLAKDEAVRTGSHALTANQEKRVARLANRLPFNPPEPWPCRSLSSSRSP